MSDDDISGPGVAVAVLFWVWVVGAATGFFSLSSFLAGLFTSVLKLFIDLFTLALIIIIIIGVLYLFAAFVFSFGDDSATSTSSSTASRRSNSTNETTTQSRNQKAKQETSVSVAGQESIGDVDPDVEADKYGQLRET